jgi:hypothetical protein
VALWPPQQAGQLFSGIAAALLLLLLLLRSCQGDEQWVQPRAVSGRHDALALRLENLRQGMGRERGMFLLKLSYY